MTVASIALSKPPDSKSASAPLRRALAASLPVRSLQDNVNGWKKEEKRGY
jgi:hypothetical protein